MLLACIAFGLNWILKTSAEVFEILRWIGAGYLVWLGVQAWRQADKTLETPRPRHRIYVSRGFLVAMTNPKTIAFFTAFLPQFVDPGLPAEHQLVVMCLVAVLMAAITDAFWAVAAGAGRAFFLKRTPAWLLGRFSGAALVGGGVWLSLARRGS